MAQHLDTGQAVCPPRPSVEDEPDATLTTFKNCSAPQEPRRRPRAPKPIPCRRGGPQSSLETRDPPLDRQHHDTDVLVMQPKTRPISQAQLVAEVKGIYAGLVMVESKCIEVDVAQPTNEDNLSNLQWQALTALHRTLLHEHHCFFLASQHPSASQALRRLAVKYAMPSRIWQQKWQFGATALELLRHRGTEVEYLRTLQLITSLLKILAEYDQFRNAWDPDLPDLENVLEEADISWEDLEEVVEKLRCLFDRYFFGPTFASILLELLSEFQGKRRHLCTTMPWTIWPALAVLWGVCWMFIYSPPPREDVVPCGFPTTYESFGDNLLGQDHSDMSLFDASGITLFDVTDVEGPHFSGALGYFPDFNDFQTGFPLTVMQASPHQRQQLITAGFEPDMQDLDGQIVGSSAVSSSAEKHSGNQGFMPGDASDEALSGRALPHTPSIRSRTVTSNRVTCHHCPESFANLFTLNRHIGEQHVDPGKKLACPHCHKKFQRGEHLDRHIARQHPTSHRASEPQQVAQETTDATTSVQRHGRGRRAIVRATAPRRQARARPPQEDSRHDDDIDDQRLRQAMRRKYQARMDALREKEQECQREREKLALLLSWLEGDAE